MSCMMWEREATEWIQMTLLVHGQINRGCRTVDHYKERNAPDRGKHHAGTS